MTRRYKLVIAYDGTNYSGYQLQENAVSVQQVLEEALTYLDRAPVRVLRASLAAADFDARKSAIGKEYRYFVYNAPILPPHLAPYWTGVPQQLDVAAMQDGAARFVGKHDFVSFAANPRREIGSTVRNVFACTVRKTGPRIVVSVRGDGFLYKQVRSMTGFLLRIGKGDERPEAVSELLEKCPPRTARVPTAPGKGLFLWRVFY